MKHRGSFPYRMDAPGRHNGKRDKQTNKRTDGQTSVRPTFRWNLTLSVKRSSEQMVAFSPAIVLVTKLRNHHKYSYLKTCQKNQTSRVSQWIYRYRLETPCDHGESLEQTRRFWL